MISGIGNSIIINSRVTEMHITGIDNSIKFGKDAFIGKIMLTGINNKLKKVPKKDVI